MTLQFGTKLKESDPIERIAGVFIKSVQESKSDSGAASKTARSRHLLPNRARDGEWATTRSLEEKLGGILEHRRQIGCFGRSFDSEHIVKPQCNPETVEARPKIRHARWNANSNC